MTPYYAQDGVTIYHGDCREVLAQLPGVDCTISDPPYARDVYLRASGLYTHPGSQTPARFGTALKRLAAGEIGNIDEIRVGVAGEIARLTRRWALVFSDVETCHQWRVDLSAAGMRYIRTGCWAKPDAMCQMTGDRPAVGFEPATICHAQGAMRWNGGGHKALWIVNTTKGNDRPDHPCPKPEALMLTLVQQFSDVGETVLDPFMGSGTTLVAAKRLGRKAIGIELDEKYCEIAATRLSQGALPMEFSA